MRPSPKELGEMVQRLAEARAVVAELTPIVARELGVAMVAQVAATLAPDAAREPGVKYRMGQRVISRAELLALAERYGVLTPDIVVRELGVERRRAVGTLSMNANRGHLVQVGRGEFSLADGKAKPVPITRGRPRGSSPLTSAISQALMRGARQGPIDGQKAAKLAGISVREAHKRLWQLKALGHLVRADDGVYALPNTPQAFAGLVKGAVEAKPKRAWKLPSRDPKAAGRLLEGSVRSKVLELAKSKPDGIITVDEVRAAGLSYKNKVKGPGNLLNALKNAGHLTRIGPSRYQVVPREQK